MFSRLFSLYTEFKIPKPDLTDKVMLVTGGASGIDKETAKALLEHNAKVYIGARDAAKARMAIDDFRSTTRKEAHSLKVHLADLNSVKAAAEQFTSHETHLHILYNNAGLLAPPVTEVSAQDYDLQFATHVIGTSCLHFTVQRTSFPPIIHRQDNAREKVRIVNTSSITHVLRGLDFATFKDGPKRQKIYTDMLYAQSKYGMIVSSELARRYGSQGIITTTLHPGCIKTNFHRNVLPAVAATHGQYPADMSALTILWAGTSAEGTELNGKYLIPWARVGVASKGTQDPELGLKLWEYLTLCLEADYFK
ncbi:NAD(P)-binding protein [Guyanagaster necrorhizus]|uniref:NAD(P)-binding protein n=1 Tax=Guyanagaster necrorhizus TaxID=856835 RepID=A0A9P8AXR9_9AGAR|nr:NAD(P)-binding protein [Guyanagaster necrorhizus MCA 3950]KAG7451670.1 NAD(P)-binding protein [Guyanagaster necrorhizus MCA 3950]